MKKHKGIVTNIRTKEELEKERMTAKKKKPTAAEAAARKEKVAADIQKTLLAFELADEADANKHLFVDRFLPNERQLLRTIIRKVKDNPVTLGWSVTLNMGQVHCTREILVQILKGDPRFASKSRVRLYSAICRYRTWINIFIGNFPWHPEIVDCLRICLLFLGERNEIGERNTITEIARKLHQNNPLFVEKTPIAIESKIRGIIRDENIFRDGYPNLSGDIVYCLDAPATTLRPRVIRCKTNKMGKDHKNATLQFDEGFEYAHGADLKCSLPDCKSQYRYCRYCDNSKSYFFDFKKMKQITHPLFPN